MDELERLINALVEGEVDVECDDTFKYDVDNGGTIYYTLDEEYTTECNHDWKEFLLKEFAFDLTLENWYVMSLLHELGHHYTVDFFTTEEWNKMCDVIESDDRKEINFDHFYKKNEYVATEWAVIYFNSRPIEMKEFCSKINAALNEIKRRNSLDYC